MIDYLSQHLWQTWAVVAFLCLIMELMAGDFFITCFAIGAVGAAILAAVGVPFVVQVILFAVITLLAIFFVRPFALRYLHRADEDRVSNADALMGRQGRVVETIEQDGFGRVVIDGDNWKARAADGQPIAEGTTVTVVGRESTIITVTPSTKRSD